jgi:hypothetical protein
MLDSKITSPEFDAAFGVVAGVGALGIAVWQGIHANWIFAATLGMVGLSCLYHARRRLKQPFEQYDQRRFTLRSMFVFTAVVAAVIWTIAYVLRH